MIILSAMTLGLYSCGKRLRISSQISMMIFVDRNVTAVIINRRMKVLWYVTRPEGISNFPCVRAHSFEDVFKIIPSIYSEGCLYHPELYS